MVLGGLLLVDAPIPEMRVHLLTALAVSIPLGAITVFLMNIALKARANKVVTGSQGLVGEIGVAQTPLSPRGKVFVHGEIWDAVPPPTSPAGQTGGSPKSGWSLLTSRSLASRCGHSGHDHGLTQALWGGHSVRRL